MDESTADGSIDEITRESASGGAGRAPVDLLLFSDGTGNLGGVTQNTNVWRLFTMLDIHDPERPVRTFYDDGLGTNSFILKKAVGLAFGAGLSQNVRDLYTFLVKNYRPGDRIYLFGFSRGAYTIRVLADMVCKMGIWKSEDYFSVEKSRARKQVRAVLREYRAIEKDPQWHKNSPQFWQDVAVEFLGVWDTVDAVGMPVDELKWLFRVREYPFVPRRWRLRQWGFSDHDLHPKVKLARQALSIDDDRWTFHPNVWNEEPGRIDQVWFAGAHSNIGGGYPKDGLSYVTLDWMLTEMATHLESAGPRLIPGKLDEVRQCANGFDRHYEPRRGLGRSYRYRPRRLEDLQRHTQSRYTRLLNAMFPAIPTAAHSQVSTLKLHRSVWERIQLATQGYAPLFLPAPDSRVQVMEVAREADGNVERPWRYPLLNGRQQQSLNRWVAARQAAYLSYAIPAIWLVILALALPMSESLRFNYCEPGYELEVTASLAYLLDVFQCNPRVHGTLLLIALGGGGLSLLLGGMIRSESASAWQKQITRWRARRRRRDGGSAQTGASQ
jgi:hypothetical protein